MHRSLDHVLAVGTDGELALADAVKHQFPWSSHVRCFRHLQNNIERHLQENHFPTCVIVAYKHDIFGWRDKENVHHKGLVDSKNGVEFERGLAALKPAWDERELKAFSTHKSYTPKFFDWFVQHKANDMKECTLKPLREEVGSSSTLLHQR